jgi:anti-sigma factor RsiW
MIHPFPLSADECRQMEAVLPPFVDGDASPSTAARVEAHLARCVECRAAVEAQRSVRALLVSRRASLMEPAPPMLAGSLRTALRRERDSSVARPRWSALAAAAAVVLAVTGGLVWGSGHSSVLLAAQLTLDHIKCFVIDGEDHDHPLTADQARAEWRDDFGPDVPVPSPTPDGRAKLVAVRECLYGDGWVPHALYRVDGQPVSVFVLSGRDASPSTIQAFGRRAQVLTSGNATYVVVAPAGIADVAEAVGLGAE